MREGGGSNKIEARHKTMQEKMETGDSESYMI